MTQLRRGGGRGGRIFGDVVGGLAMGSQKVVGEESLRRPHDPRPGELLKTSRVNSEIGECAPPVATTTLQSDQPRTRASARAVSTEGPLGANEASAGSGIGFYTRCKICASFEISTKAPSLQGRYGFRRRQESFMKSFLAFA